MLSLNSAFTSYQWRKGYFGTHIHHRIRCDNVSVKAKSYTNSEGRADSEQRTVCDTDVTGAGHTYVALESRKEKQNIYMN